MGDVENKSWQAIKTLISLEFENCPLDPNKPLFITVDSSQITTGYLLFQISNDGYIKMIFTKSKISKEQTSCYPRADRTKLFTRERRICA